MKLILVMYRLLYRLTNDRRWLLKCIDIINQVQREEVITFLNSKEEQYGR